MQWPPEQTTMNGASRRRLSRCHQGGAACRPRAPGAAQGGARSRVPELGREGQVPDDPGRSAPGTACGTLRTSMEIAVCCQHIKTGRLYPLKKKKLGFPAPLEKLGDLATRPRECSWLAGRGLLFHLNPGRLSKRISSAKFRE